MKKTALALALLLAAALCLPAQQAPAAWPEPAAAFTVSSPGGAVLSFRPRGRTTVDLAGTDRAPQATGSARVENRSGYLEVEISRIKVYSVHEVGRTCSSGIEPDSVCDGVIGIIVGQGKQGIGSLVDSATVVRLDKGEKNLAFIYAYSIFSVDG